MRSRDEGIETVFASYANMTEEKKQKFTQVTAAITSGLPSMCDCFNDRLDGAKQLAVAKWTVSMSYLVHEIIKEFVFVADLLDNCKESEDAFWCSPQFLVQRYNQFRKEHPTDKHSGHLDETVFD